MELKVGMRVRGYNYTGTVFNVDGDRATIKRDDGVSGNGYMIDSPRYNGQRGWGINYVGREVRLVQVH